MIKYCVIQLNKIGVDVNGLDANNWSALSLAARNGREDIVNYLLSAGADPNLGPKTALCAASYSGHQNIIKLLLDKGCAINAVDDDGWTALLRAYQGGHNSAIQQLHEAGANPKIGKWTPLGVVALVGNRNIANDLIDRGCDINVRDWYGWTALMRAYQGGQRDTVRLLRDAGANPKLGKVTALGAAALGGRLDMVESLIQEGHDVNELDADSVSPLNRAYYGGNRDIVDLLLRSGAQPGRGEGKPLVIAATGGHTSMVEELLNKGHDINEKSERGNSPLCVAVYHGHLKTIKLLLDRGADTSLGHMKCVLNPEGLTALGLAKKRKRQLVVTLLEKHGVTK